MSIVVVPADQAHLLFHLTPPLRKFPVRRFVVHTANIEATTCETCGGKGKVRNPYGPGMHVNTSNVTCCTCAGKGTVPAVVTFAVECEQGVITTDGYDHSWCGRTISEPLSCEQGFRPVGTATVVNCWPIVGTDGCKDETAHVCVSWDERITLHTPLSQPNEDGDTETFITGQVVGNPQPGRWMLELADVEATP